MPWKERETVEEKRTRFVAEVLEGERSLSEICRESGISRTTGYKWLDRARSNEPMSDRRSGPMQAAGKTEPQTEELILKERARHPAWGARKLKRYLENHGKTGIPAQSTICEILKRNGIITPEESQAHRAYRRFEKEAPNQMWQMDFKGDFGLLNQTRCHPLTVLDDHSRYSICLEAKENQQGEGVFAILKRLLVEHGLPESILCDNGAPWGDSKPGGITRFDVWMMQLGVLPIHCRPLHPQTQGKDERFHRTLKDEVLKREVFYDMESAQRRFDAWRYEYNYERPHDALNLATPASRYRVSARKMPEVLQEPEYEPGCNLRKVNYKGYISIQSHRYYLSEAFIGKMIEISPMRGDEIGLFYGNYRVAKIDLDEQIFTSRRIYEREYEN